MLACFLKNNKSILKKFKGDTSKKRSRANSNVSAASSTKKRDKKVKDKKKKKTDESVAKGTRSRTQSVEWTPNPDHAVDNTEVKDFNFSRIKVEKFQNLEGSAADYSFEAKGKFGAGGDTYGDWSNSKLGHIHGKNFIKEKNKMKNKNFH